MDKSKTLNTLKNAFFMEQQGKVLYETARDKAVNGSVKTFFQSLADDEQEHMDILEQQFKSYMDNGKFKAKGIKNGTGAETAQNLLNREVKENINAAGFESTAITAAIGFEKRAIELYSLRSQEAEDSEEKKLYQWLSNWEKNHLKELISLQESLMEKIWEDNNFWPF